MAVLILLHPTLGALDTQWLFHSYDKHLSAYYV